MKVLQKKSFLKVLLNQLLNHFKIRTIINLKRNNEKNKKELKEKKMRNLRNKKKKRSRRESNLESI